MTVSHSKTRIVFMTLMLLAAVLSFVRMLLFAGVLSPEQFGYFSLGLLIYTFSSYIQFGLLSGLTRELPFRLGEDRREQAFSLVGEALVAIIILHVVALVIFISVMACFPLNDASKQLAVNLGFIAGLSMVYWRLSLLVLESQQMFMVYAKAQFIYALTISLCGVLACYYYGFGGGLLVITILSMIGFFALVNRYMPFLQLALINKANLKYLLSIGFPLVMASLVMQVLWNIDKLFINYVGTIQDVGFYQFAAVPVLVGPTINSILNTYLQPKILFQAGRGKDPKQLYLYSLRLGAKLFALGAIFSPLVIYAYDLVVRAYYPEYINALPLFKYFYFSTVLIGSNFSAITYNVINKQKALLLVSVLVAVIALAAGGVIVYVKAPIANFAVLNFAAQVGYALATIGVAYRLTKGL